MCESQNFPGEIIRGLEPLFNNDIQVSKMVSRGTNIGSPVLWYLNTNGGHFFGWE